MTTRNGETTSAHERVVENFVRGCKSKISGQESEFRVHGCGVNVVSFLKRVIIQYVTLSAAYEAAEEEAQRTSFLAIFILLEDSKGLLRIFHFDGAIEVHVFEGLYNTSLLREGA